MPEYKAPGVYVEEVSFRARSIEGVPTTTAALLGYCQTGPMEPTPVTSLSEFTATFGAPTSGRYLALAVRGFFENGGTRCYILRLPDDLVTATAGAEGTLAPLDSLSDISIVCCPDEDAAAGITAALVEHCERMRYRIAVLAGSSDGDLSQAPPSEAQTSYAAYYAPWVLVKCEAGSKPVAVHPGGHVTGVMAASDVQRGIFKAPANLPIAGIAGLSRKITAAQQAELNVRGVNVLRNLPGRGYRVWGARSTSSDPEWKYISVRRYMNYLEHSIDKGLQWVVFEPNGEQLWGNVRSTIESFLQNEWLSGALLGEKPEQAYFVRCDRTTMTQDDIDNRRLVCLVGVAPLKPAEFVIVRISQWTASATCT